MSVEVSKSTLGAISLNLLALAAIIWAAPSIGAAHLRDERASEGASRAAEPRYRRSLVKASGVKSLPLPVRFREVEGRGLLVSAWVNGAGPYTFAVDTGAGATIISERVAGEAHVTAGGSRASISGLSGIGIRAGREARLQSLAIGERDNFLPSQSPAIVVGGLPEGIDGVLDPTEGYWPLGYSIDMPNEELAAFDPRLSPVRVSEAPPDGAVVPWLTDSHTRRPFVMLDLGRRALVDTGSGFGLAMSESVARASGISFVEGRARGGVRDLGGGMVAARRVPPITVRIGSLTLRRVPTDVVSGAESGAPILLGREALQPFHLTFDPVNRLVKIGRASCRERV